MTTANCQHKAVVTGGEHPNDPPLFRWINTLLGNLRTSLNGSFHAFNDRCARLRRCQVDLATGEFLQDGKLLAPRPVIARCWPMCSSTRGFLMFPALAPGASP
jgi:hypothetical protein